MKRNTAQRKPIEVDQWRRDLQIDEDWYRDLVEHSHDLLCTHDLEGRLLSVNPAPARVLGYSVGELIETPMRELIVPEFREQFDAYLGHIERTGEARGIMAVLTRSGTRRFWEYCNTLRTEGVARPIVRGIAHDVTEQVCAVQALRASHEKLVVAMREQEETLKGLTLFRTLLDQSQDAIEVVDPETLGLLDVNQRACVELGYTREELLSMSVFDIDKNAEESSCARVHQQLLESGFVIMESVHRRKDGTTFPVEINLRRVELDRTYIVAVSRDITDRKRAQEALRQSEERFRVALKHSPITVFSQDRDQRYTWIYNSQVMGVPNEILGKTPIDCFGPGEGARISENLRQVLETGQGAHHEISTTYDGRKRYFDTTLEPILDSAGAVIGITGASMDITVLREMTEALREAQAKLTEEKLYLEHEIDTELGFGEIIGRSKALTSVMQRVAKVANSPATVLVMGETGTGKELIARAIHRLSGRRENSFIKLNCAAIPSGLLESELFGHEKGAFTGAVSRKLGRLELADGGTLFLDEIGEIPLELQPKLLRVLQDQEFERLGGTHTMKVDFRLVAATNRDLAKSVESNRFRSDLYYRLNVFPIQVPPLRERREDIRLLVEHFVVKYSKKLNKSVSTISKKTMEMLMQWDWPGNVRELENVVERSLILTHGPLLQVPLHELRTAAGIPASPTLQAVEREHILRALQESGGTLGGARGAAARLGIKRTTLQSKLKRLGIDYRRHRR